VGGIDDSYQVGREVDTFTRRERERDEIVI
jgi:hypothetical protein